MAKVVPLKEAIALVKKGDSLMTTGFLGISCPIKLIEGLVEAGTDELTLIQAVTAFPLEHHDVGKLAENRQIKKFIGAHAGTSKVFVSQFLKGELEIEFIPMGTLVEMIHAGGAGLGAVLTPTGVGTAQEETHEKVVRNGKEYLVYDPLTADVAFIKANKADTYGNLYLVGTAKTTALQMALASKTVIAEVDEIVEPGEIDPSDVYVPGMLVDYIVQGLTPDERHAYYEALWSRHNLLTKEED